VDRDGQVLQADSGRDAATTNNRMELTAVIEALRWARRNGEQHVTMVTDSQYVRQGITAWIHNWKRNGWQTTAKKPVKNADLWRALDDENAAVDPQWRWVKGHAGDEHNEACDRAVQQAIRGGRR
jgi:ribonuclease HI